MGSRASAAAARADAAQRLAHLKPPRQGKRDRAAHSEQLALTPIAVLLFASGFCALAYQTTWLRELRLVFGVSTQASAATLAIFMAGLCAGGAWIARFVDREPKPLRLYGRLELGIVAGVVASPLVLIAARSGYIALGGETALGPGLATPLRLLLATLVMGLPAFLMGATLPAVARAVEHRSDSGRRRLALLYGVNTLGAVAGAVLTTFMLFETFGSRATLFGVAGVNLALALAALALARHAPRPDPDLEVTKPPQHSSDRNDDDAGGGDRTDGNPPRHRRFVLIAACFVGFLFFLMEIVWFRMLGPLLGGTTFTFGLILAVALLGIGLGGVVYSAVLAGRRPTLLWLGATCAFQALGIALPFALGDRLAVVALLLRPLGQFHFAGMVAAWAVIAVIVVLPAALVAGFQFPLLIGLLGDGLKRVGRDTGLAYAWNTGGAIAGSLAGGFLLLPLITAPGLWTLCAVLSAAFAVAAVIVHRREVRSRRTVAGIVLVAGVALACTLVPRGPTALWRDGGIGAGRRDAADYRTRNSMIQFERNYRSSVAWRAEGRESSVAIHTDHGNSLLVGGKSDGNLINDAGTQIMVGLLGAFLHDEPKHALVIGLGTGSSAGWLGRVAAVEQVDAVELEPAVLEMVRRCSAGNGDPLGNPKVRIHLRDGREFLQTTRATYDLIASEPSNPYRAGVASLYAQEFYRAAADRLNDDGLFLQWLQSYEVDAATLGTVYATMATSFPVIETWATLDGDLLLVASRKRRSYDIQTLRRRLREEPFRSGVAAAWRVTELEGLRARFIGNSGLATKLARQAALNTDDRTVLEFAFARTMGRQIKVQLGDLQRLAFAGGDAVPPWTNGEIDGGRVIVQRSSARVMEGRPPPFPPVDHPLRSRAVVMKAFLDEDYALALQNLTAIDSSDLTELAIGADLMAGVGSPRAPELIAELARWRPAEAAFIEARFHLHEKNIARAAEAYVRACQAYRRLPWAWPLLAARSIPLANNIAAADSTGRFAQRVFEALEAPFAAQASNFRRLATRTTVAEYLDGGTPGKYVREALEAFDGPDFRWDHKLLRVRAASYRNLNDPRAGRAERELQRFIDNQGAQLPAVAGLVDELGLRAR